MSSFLYEAQKEIGSKFLPLREDIERNMIDLRQEISSDLQMVKKETNDAILQSGQELNSKIQLIREEGLSSIFQTGDAIKSDISLFREELEGLNEEMKKIMGEIGTFHEKIRVGFAEVKEDLGSMIKLSYGDLERRLEALEARVKALEKLVLC